MKLDQFSVVMYVISVYVVAVAVHSVLVISTCSHKCVHMDLGLWISHSDLGQPSQKRDHGKVKASINGSICRRGQCSQSNMGTGMRWTASHQHRQQTSAQVCFLSKIWAQE
jgi:hypothetical protein